MCNLESSQAKHHGDCPICNSKELEVECPLCQEIDKVDALGDNYFYCYRCGRNFTNE